MIKKYFIPALALLMLLCFFCACEKKDTESDNITIVTTVFPQYDFAKKITAGTDAKIEMLIPPGCEPHAYEPTPSDMVIAAECDLFIGVGGESEAWAEKIISAANIDVSRRLYLMDMVPLLEVESGHGNGEHSHAHIHGDHDHGHIHDEHVWTSPKNAMIIVDAIAKRLCEIDPQNEALYLENAETYLSELSKLDKEFSVLAENAAKVPLVFGDRFPFLYLARAYGFEYTSPFRGCSAHTEASMAEIADAIEAARNADSGTIFSVDFGSQKLALTIADEADARICRLYSCHTVSAEYFEKGIGYIDLMKKNLENIREAVEN